jgi:hypothetical protein
VTDTGGTTPVTTPAINQNVAALMGGGWNTALQSGTVPTWQPGAVTDGEDSHIHQLVLSSSFQAGNTGAAVIPGGGTYNTSPSPSPHSHALSNANAKLNVPSVNNGGLPQYFKLSAWLRA